MLPLSWYKAASANCSFVLVSCPVHFSCSQKGEDNWGRLADVGDRLGCRARAGTGRLSCKWLCWISQQSFSGQPEFVFLVVSGGFRCLLCRFISAFTMTIFRMHVEMWLGIVMSQNQFDCEADVHLAVEQNSSCCNCLRSRYVRMWRVSEETVPSKCKT